MELVYYFRQWPGGFGANVLRLLHVIFLELRRIVASVKYIAEFDLTDKCNLNCAHCYHFRENNHLTYNDLPASDWLSKFRELHKKGIKRVLLIGGEPTMRMDIVKMAIEIFPYVDICTNGTVKIESLRKMQPKLFVSLDGMRDSHDALRGKGVFDKVLSHYKNDKRVVFSMTITNDNLNQLENVVKLAIENGVAGVSCDIYTPSPDMPQSDPMFISYEKRMAITDEMFRLRKKYPRHFLMSRSAIMWFRKTDHKNQKCYWRQGVLHFNTCLEERPSCKDLDCGNCGHFAQANLSPLNRFI